MSIFRREVEPGNPSKGTELNKFGHVAGWALGLGSMGLLGVATFGDSYMDLAGDRGHKSDLADERAEFQQDVNARYGRALLRGKFELTFMDGPTLLVHPGNGIVGTIENDSRFRPDGYVGCDGIEGSDYDTRDAQVGTYSDGEPARAGVVPTEQGLDVVPGNDRMPVLHLTLGDGEYGNMQPLDAETHAQLEALGCDPVPDIASALAPAA